MELTNNFVFSSADQMATISTNGISRYTFLQAFDLLSFRVPFYDAALTKAKYQYAVSTLASHTLSEAELRKNI